MKGMVENLVQAASISALLFLCFCSAAPKTYENQRKQEDSIRIEVADLKVKEILSSRYLVLLDNGKKIFEAPNTDLGLNFSLFAKRDTHYYLEIYDVPTGIKKIFIYNSEKNTGMCSEWFNNSACSDSIDIGSFNAEANKINIFNTCDENNGSYSISISGCSAIR
jgi:hypothetical protein